MRHVVDQLVAPEARKAVFLVGSLPLGMATGGSDVDLILLVDSRAVILNNETGNIREGASDLLVKHFWFFVGGVDIDVMMVITPTINSIYECLRGKNPWLGESEIMILSRLGAGWLLWQSDQYLERNGVVINNSELDVRCSTKRFVFAFAHREKAVKALAVNDISLCLHHGRLSVEKAYLAYFSSEGLSYLGDNWLAQITRADGALERVHRHPLLMEYVHLLFPVYRSTQVEAAQYLQAVSESLTKIRRLIEEKSSYRLAYGILDDVFRDWADQCILSHVDERRCYSTF